MKKKTLPLDVGVALVIMAIIAVMAFEGLVRQKLPAIATRFPIFIFVVVAVVGTAEIVRSIRAANKEDSGKKKKIFVNFKNFIVMICMLAVYGVLLPLIGFIAATILFSVVFVFYFKFKRITIFSICMSAAIVAVYYLFTQVLYIHLPVGALFNMLM